MHNAKLLGGPKDGERLNVEGEPRELKCLEQPDLSQFWNNPDAAKMQESLIIHRYIFKFYRAGLRIYVYDGKV